MCLQLLLLDLFFVELVVAVEHAAVQLLLVVVVAALLFTVHLDHALDEAVVLVEAERVAQVRLGLLVPCGTRS